MKYDECPIFKASGHCLDGTFDGVGIDEFGTEECRKCAYKQCIVDLASDFAEEAINVTADFIKGERKAMEGKNEKRKE